MMDGVNKYECEHALCNAHLKRELTGIEENFEQQWVKEINELRTYAVEPKNSNSKYPTV